MITQQEMISIAHWTIYDLYNWAKGKTAKQVVGLIRDLQKAQTAYSSHNGILDPIQGKILSIRLKLEKWLKKSYVDQEIKKMKRTDTLLRTPQGYKAEANNRWEKWFKKESY